jgi:hypothetical protein
MIAILVLSAFVFAVGTQVVIGVEGTATKDGDAIQSPLQLKVTTATGGAIINNGLIGTKPDNNGVFSALVGSGATQLQLTCGTQYTLNISVCTAVTTAEECALSTATTTSVGGYKFTACYGTQGDFNVPGMLTVSGIATINGITNMNNNVNIGTATSQKKLTVNGDLDITGMFSPTIKRQMTKNEYGETNYNANKNTELGNWDICFLTKVELEPGDSASGWGGCEIKVEWIGTCSKGSEFTTCNTNANNKPMWTLYVQDNKNWAMCGVTCMNFGP